MPLQDEIKRQQERFDKRFENVTLQLATDIGVMNCVNGKEEIKAFLAQAITESTRKMYEENLKLFREYREKYPDANFDDAIGLLLGSEVALRFLNN